MISRLAFLVIVYRKQYGKGNHGSHVHVDIDPLKDGKLLIKSYTWNINFPIATS